MPKNRLENTRAKTPHIIGFLMEFVKIKYIKIPATNILKNFK
jgi:hypothetical protein